MSKQNPIKKLFSLNDAAQKAATAIQTLIEHECSFSVINKLNRDLNGGTIVVTSIHGADYMRKLIKESRISVDARQNLICELKVEYSNNGN